MKTVLFVFFVLLLVVSSFSVQASDIISINSGGNQASESSTDRIVLTSARHVGGIFFSFPSPSSEDDEEPAPSDDSGSSGGGGGGGGVVSPTISVQPTEFNVDVQVNTSVRRAINVTNFGTSSAVVSISQQSLENRIIVSGHGAEDVILGTTEITVPAGETLQFEVEFRGLSEPGIYTGQINIGGVSVDVALNVKTLLLLFDSNIVVLNEEYTVKQGGELNTLVTLIPMGDDSRLDVTLDFEIRDYSGKVYLTKSDTLLVTEYVNVERIFDTGMLPAGSYIIGLNLIYPGGVAPSSAHFIVAEREVPDVVGKLMFFIVILILLIVMALIVIFIVKRIRNRENEGEQQETPSPDQGQFFPQFPGTMQ